MSICSVNGHIFCKLALVAEAMSLVADLAMPVEINMVSWGRLHAMCNPLTCDSILLGIIYVMLWPAAPPRYVYQHGQYSLIVVILPVWTPWSDSGLCSGYLPAAGRVGWRRLCEASRRVVLSQRLFLFPALSSLPVQPKARQGSVSSSFLLWLPSRLLLKTNGFCSLVQPVWHTEKKTVCESFCSPLREGRSGSCVLCQQACPLTQHPELAVCSGIYYCYSLPNFLKTLVCLCISLNFPWCSLMSRWLVNF